MAGFIKKDSFKSLTATLAIAFIAVSAVILLISSCLGIYFIFKTQKKVVSNQQIFIAKDVADAIGDFIQEKFYILNTSARLEDISSLEKKELESALDKLLGFDQSFRQLVLLDTQKRKLTRSSSLSKSISMSEQAIKRAEMDILSKVSHGDIYVGPIYIDELIGEPMAIIAFPVNDALGNPKGALLAEVDFKFMWDLINNIKIGKKGFAYMVDKTGRLIAFSDISRLLKGENVSHIREVAEILKGGDEEIAEISKGINGNYVVARSESIGLTEWTVVVELPAIEAYKTIIANIKLNVLVMCLSFALSTMVAIYLSKKITKPIINLRDAAGEIGNGNLDARIMVESDDEIGQLATSFNQMVDDLKKTTVTRDSLIKEVAEREKAENNLKETMKKLEQANLNMKQFVYIASHDLREPLRKVTSFGGILQESLGDKISEDDAESLSYMIDGAERMSQMIEGLLSYSRVSTKGRPSEVVDLNELLKQLEELELSVLLEEKNVTLEIPQGLPPVEADPSQIRQLLQNFIANGIRYQPKDGIPHITITSRPADDGMVRIEVTDNGIGIKPENQDAVFEMFRRLHSRDEYEGTGIGLAVCKKIVERHGGQIGVESEYRKGSTFWFTVPAAEQLVANAT